MTGKTLYEKIWEKHIVHSDDNGPSIMYVDLHLLIEVSSPQAFQGLRDAGRTVRCPDRCLATIDHAIPTKNRHLPFKDKVAQKMVDVLRENSKEFKIKLLDLNSAHQGIIHVIAPELGLSMPGQTIVCGDSHTSTHGAFGALAFGIGTSEVEAVLATQCLSQFKSKTLSINITGDLPTGTTAKDIVLAIMGKYGTKFATGYTIEYRGDTINQLTMEQRMTICNMSIEMGGRAGLIAPDETTFEFLKGKPYAPEGESWNKAIEEWRELYSDYNAKFDLELELNANEVEPQVTWGTNPSHVIPVTSQVPNPVDLKGSEREIAASALKYMDLLPGTPMTDIHLDKVFLGSCTNSRLEDLRAAAQIVKGHKVADSVKAIVVPGSQDVKLKAEAEELDKIFLNAGFEWRDSGCSMCLGMNDDAVEPGERCASTSNRNFEGRQGRNARTHLVSPPMAAAAAIKGHFVDVRNW